MAASFGLINPDADAERKNGRGKTGTYE
jgi:hypothetical protein